MNTVHLQRLAVTIASGALAASAVSLAVAGGVGGPTTGTPTHALETNRPVEAVPATLAVTPLPPETEPEPVATPAPERSAPAITRVTPASTPKAGKPEQAKSDKDDKKHETVKPRIRDDDDDDDDEDEDHNKERDGSKDGDSTQESDRKKGDSRKRSSDDGESRSETETRRLYAEER